MIIYSDLTIYCYIVIVNVTFLLRVRWNSISVRTLSGVISVLDHFASNFSTLEFLIAIYFSIFLHRKKCYLNASTVNFVCLSRAMYM
jgi:hypothetical protein